MVENIWVIIDFDPVAFRSSSSTLIHDGIIVWHSSFGHVMAVDRGGEKVRAFIMPPCEVSITEKKEGDQQHSTSWVFVEKTRPSKPSLSIAFVFSFLRSLFDPCHPFISKWQPFHSSWV